MDFVSKLSSYFKAPIKADGMGGMPPVNFSLRVAAYLPSNLGTVCEDPSVFNFS